MMRDCGRDERRLERIGVIGELVFYRNDAKA